MLDFPEPDGPHITSGLAACFIAFANDRAMLCAHVRCDPFIQRLLIYMVITAIVIFYDHHIRQCTYTSYKPFD